MELLRDPAFVLRTWQPDDLDALYDLYSRWEVMRWLGAEPRRALADVDEARARLERWAQVEQRLSAPFGLWALVPKRPDGGGGPETPVGTVLLLPLEDSDGPTDQVEVGWHLHPDHQGRGLVTRSARALLSAAADSGQQRVLALTDPDNVKSQAVAGRLGMLDEGLTERWFGLTTRQYATAQGPASGHR